jgi:hypothetical protein
VEIPLSQTKHKYVSSVIVRARLQETDNWYYIKMHPTETVFAATDYWLVLEIL